MADAWIPRRIVRVNDRPRRGRATGGQKSAVAQPTLMLCLTFPAP
jgi:hypothetical protein